MFTHNHPRLFLTLILLSLTLMLVPPQTHAASNYIMVLEADGAIVPAMQNYIERGISQAEDDNAKLIIIRLNTPGGNINTMDDIIQDILESDVPVVVYVAPRGAMAGSAGALITFAGHKSAMSPDTVIGAASPINGDGTDMYSTVDAKTRNILLATVRNLTKDRPEVAQMMAQKMITDAEAVSVEEALESGLIDFIAKDNRDLIRQLDMQDIQVKDKTVTLDLTGIEIRTVGMNFIEQTLLVLTDPTIVFSLLSVGILLIIIELSSPGGWFAGITGAVCLILALYGLGVLPINWIGIILMGAALVMFVFEIQMPGTQGFLSLGAAIALGVGGYILFSRPELDQYGEVPLFLIIAESAVFGGLASVVVFFAMRTQHQPPITGEHGMIGMLAEVRVALEPRGKVYVHGEWWNAETENGSYINKDEMVKIVGIDGLLLRVVSADTGALHKGPPKPIE